MPNNVLVLNRNQRTNRIELAGVSALAVFLLAEPLSQLWGQAVANAQIRGLIEDPSGAAVSNANVSATQIETRSAYTAISASLPKQMVNPY